MLPSMVCPSGLPRQKACSAASAASRSGAARPCSASCRAASRAGRSAPPTATVARSSASLAGPWSATISAKQRSACVGIRISVNACIDHN